MIRDTSGLAATATPASDVMWAALGKTGARLMAAGIAVSTLGFLSQSMLTAPRVYYAMAADRLFFRSVGWLHPRTRVPVVAIALQGVCAVTDTSRFSKPPVGQLECLNENTMSRSFVVEGKTLSGIADPVGGMQNGDIPNSLAKPTPIATHSQEIRNGPVL